MIDHSQTPTTPDASRDGVDPELLERLGTILRDVQGRRPEGPDEALPNITDRSITMVNLIIALEEQLRVEVPLEVFYEVGTLRELAEAVAAQPSYRGVGR